MNQSTATETSSGDDRTSENSAQNNSAATHHPDASVPPAGHPFAPSSGLPKSSEPSGGSRRPTTLHELFTGLGSSCPIGMAIASTLTGGNKVRPKVRTPETIERKGYTPLMVAIKDECAPCVLACVISSQRGVIDAVDHKGRNAAYIAADKGHMGALSMLLDAGALPSGKGWSDGRNLLHILGQRDEVELIDVVARKVAERGGLEGVAALANQEDLGGQTPLAHAVMCSKQPVPHTIRVLAAHGADVNERVLKGNTLLHFSIHGNVQADASALLDAGADIDAKSDKGSTALHLAARRGHKNAARLLLSRGARTDLLDAKGKDALAVAVTTEMRRIIEHHAERQRVHAL